MTKRKYLTKAVIFDFDGTLTMSKGNSNCWRYIWEEIGKVDIDDSLVQKYLSGEIDMDEWTSRVLQYYRQFGVSREILNSASSHITVRDGVFDVFSFLHKQKIKIFICSGGLKQIVENCLGDNLSFVDGIECDEFAFDERGSVTDIIRTKFDMMDKQHFICDLCAKLQISPSELVFVGNGINDETAHNSGAKTICINPNSTNPNDKNLWDIYIEDIKNLSEILDYID